MMAKEIDGGPAFPTENWDNAMRERPVGFRGMTLRDYFAAQALAGMGAGWAPIFDWSVLDDGEYGSDEWHARAHSERAKYAYAQADAMLVERSK